MTDFRRLSPLLLLPLLGLPGCAQEPLPPSSPNAIDLLVAPWTPETQRGLIGPPIPPRLLLREPGVPLAPALRPQAVKPRLVLQRSGQAFPKFGDPAWILSLEEPGQPPIQLAAVSGRAWAQRRDRNVGGTKAPLPIGDYTIGQIHQGPFSMQEIGGLYFVDLTPRFTTGRSDLGIHWDPSLDRDKRESGTDGCVATQNPDDLRTVVNFLRRTGATTLTVLD